MDRFLSLLLVFLSFGSTCAWAEQFAMVTSKKAIIYADPNLKVPIGTVAKGKVLLSGDRVRRHTLAVAVSVGRKVAYLKTSDVILEKFVGPHLRKSIHEKAKKQMGSAYDDTFGENSWVSRNYQKEALHFSYAPIPMNSSPWKGLRSKLDTAATSEWGHLLKMGFGKRAFLYWNFALGLDALFYQSGLTKLMSPAIFTQVDYHLFHFKDFSSDLSLELRYSPISIWTIGNENYQDRSAGAGINLYALYQLFSDLKFFFSAGYFRWHLLSSPVMTLGNKFHRLNDFYLEGLKLQLGLKLTI